ncbi:carbohydrate kinase [Aureimonas altamirensis]|uniref:FGGY-family carbohydrate kinase n=1 Tax=Aureimonas altamirensis TaxID=370622 RepID=UPI001E611E77|nr:FGGY-family carbohydrate kinase [Aureimonas altamirensis]UHD44267.1 carbohydrate kinase [Aureimonas altamirensis]
MPSILGIDNGLTVTKAVIFDADGRQLAVARRRVPQDIPHPRHVERDMAGLWRATAEAIRDALAASGRPAGDIVAIAATAHGDGLYLLDRERRPLGPGILSLDSRALDIVKRWSGAGLFDAALELTGQAPHVSAPSALLAWIRDNEPERYARIGHVLGCKDWLRYCLTDTIGTDRTEASTSFTDVTTQAYSRQAVELFGLSAIFDALAPMAGSAEIVGHVTAQAAAATGLVEGTPVACGLHDVTASALGAGGHRHGVVDIVAGTYSINEVVTDTPRVDARWFCRNGIAPGQWNAMSISPASAANYDWFLDTVFTAELEASHVGGQPIHALAGAELDAALARPSGILFHPYLFGSPQAGPASAGFFGLHGWHKRGDMLRAVLEGIAFNHRYHIDALADGFRFDAARLTGGISRNPSFAQLFADVIGRPVTLSTTEETAAFGAVLCAGAAVGLYDSPMADPRGAAVDGPTYRPDAARHDALSARYAVYRNLTDAMAPLWPQLESLSEGSQQ